MSWEVKDWGTLDKVVECFHCGRVETLNMEALLEHGDDLDVAIDAEMRQAGHGDADCMQQDEWDGVHDDG
jgi:hypothetical protein